MKMNRTIFFMVTSAGSWGRGVSEQDALRAAVANVRKTISKDNLHILCYHFPANIVKDVEISPNGKISWKWADGVTPEIGDILYKGNLFLYGEFVRAKNGKITRADEPISLKSRKRKNKNGGSVQIMYT